ncbi:MAG: hypothetical protein LBI31_00590, partial [Zoogloeaceae bacterium]|nr:hypothetical protein [Zoogloeaceae bacterium]
MTKNPLFFGIAKWVAFAFALLALAGCLFSLSLTLMSFDSRSFDVPKFNAETFSKEKRRYDFNYNANDPQAQAERLEITKKYGDKILAVITSRDLKMKVEDVVRFLQENIPTERQSDFVSGWEAYLNQGMAFLQSNNRLTNTSGEELNRLYQRTFADAMSESANKEKRIAEVRIFFLGSTVALAILFVMAMIVP